MERNSVRTGCLMAGLELAAHSTVLADRAPLGVALARQVIRVAIEMSNVAV
jgi:hypothetical protein